VKVLVVGVGGLGCPAALALAEAGVLILGLADDDSVDRTNLHRQILFSDSDVGKDKATAARRALVARASSLDVRVHGTRLLPHNAVELVRQYDLVLEGSDNFATKFLAADACAIARVPVIHGAAIRWRGTVLAANPSAGGPCYRCLFEDLPREDAPNCAEAGVIGPVVGLTGALQADLGLALLAGVEVAGELVTVDGKNAANPVRRRRVGRRPSCPLCGTSPTITSILEARYTGAPTCDSATPTMQ